MGAKRYKPEEIISKLREAEVLLAEGVSVAEVPTCVIGIEACTGAYFWQRQIEALGHDVRIIAPQHVKPFGRRQKNDRNDAEAITIAVSQLRMRFVQKKSVAQQDVQSLHRARRRMVNHQGAPHDPQEPIIPTGADGPDR